VSGTAPSQLIINGTMPVLLSIFWSSSAGTLGAPSAPYDSASSWLPRVRNGRFASRTRPDLVELIQCLLRQLDLQSMQACGKLVHHARSDDRRSHDRIVKQPSGRYVSGLFTKAFAQRFVCFEVGPKSLYFLFESPASAFRRFLQCAAQQTTANGAPWNDPRP